MQAVVMPTAMATRPAATWSGRYAASSPRRPGVPLPDASGMIRAKSSPLRRRSACAAASFSSKTLDIASPELARCGGDMGGERAALSAPPGTRRGLGEASRFCTVGRRLASAAAAPERRGVRTLSERHRDRSLACGSGRCELGRSSRCGCGRPINGEPSIACSSLSSSNGLVGIGSESTSKMLRSSSSPARR
jgi:hypothetical protein